MIIKEHTPRLWLVRTFLRLNGQCLQMFRGFCPYAFKCFGYKFSKRTVFYLPVKTDKRPNLAPFF